MQKYVNLSSFGIEYSLKDSAPVDTADIIISDSGNDIKYALGHNKAHIYVEHTGVTDSAGVTPEYVFIPDNDLLPFPDNDYIETAYLRHCMLPKNITESKRLYIRELSYSDMEELLSFSENDAGLLTEDPDEKPLSLAPETSSFGFTAEMSEEDKKDYYRAYYKSMYDLCGYGYYGLFLKDSGELCGYAGLAVPESGCMSDGISIDDHSVPNYHAANCPEGGCMAPSIGYFILPAFRGRGLAFEAMDAILAFAEKELGIFEFVCNVKSCNMPSVITAGKLSNKHTMFIRKQL